MVLLGGTLIAGSGMLGGNRLRAAAGLVVTGVRLAVTRANTTGRPVRLVFDFDGNRLVLEETAGRMLRVKDTGDKQKSEGASAGADPATELEKESLEYAESIVKGPRAPRARFTPVPLGANAEAEGRELGAGIRYRQVHTEHDDEPRTKGRAYLYFWPGGGTERAVIQLGRGEEDVLSVLVSPLTGRAKVQRGKVELEAPRTEGDYGEREEP
jgi:general secretion pathway protein H